ncbi:MAG TPA: polyphosphate:AMP phosphotransferase [Candidatus Acidoferrum sp.]|nr:polyphosphate:AMP phosphotransferase [Candidatus Acidoferrum sp.]
MLQNIDLSRTFDKASFKAQKTEADLKLGDLQRTAKSLEIPTIILFEGWSASGKGTLINELILPLDPRGFTVYSARRPTEEEAFYPFLWRFWKRTPTRGRIAIFDRSWNRRVIVDRIEEPLKGQRLRQAFEDIRSFERQLTDEGTVIVKFFLHISKTEQERRFDNLRANGATAWRVTKDDIRQHERYAEYLAATEEMLTETDTDFAAWTIVEAHDRRFATLKIFATVIDTLERRIAAADRKSEDRPPASQRAGHFKTIALDQVDLSLSLSPEEYDVRIKRAQNVLRELEHEIYLRRVPVVIVYEGWDAAGKGGNIRRLTKNLDPRGYEVVPIAAPNDVEKAHHYLWRFWAQMPKAGHITIFDRSWYGRVLVERVEGFCTEAQWRRAYREINAMEQHLVHFGTIVLKFWLHIHPDEQLRRFNERQGFAHKQWKITDEDWRNREKMPQYRDAVEEMLHRTTTPYAPWTIVESNCKRYARIKVLETVCEAIRTRLAH